MRSEYSKWFWSECDELNKDTSFAYSLAEKAWNYRQTEVDELKLQVAEMKSRLNDAYTDGQSAMYTARQSKVDELQKQLIDQGQRFNDQAQRVKDLEHKNDELQKRVDASLIAFEKLKEEINELHGQCDLHLIKYLEEKAQVLEQAIKGDQ